MLKAVFTESNNGMAGLEMYQGHYDITCSHLEKKKYLTYVRWNN